MKLLFDFDQNLSFKLCRQLIDVFPDSNQVRLVGLEGADDGTIVSDMSGYPFSAQTMRGKTSSRTSNELAKFGRA
jgi:Domain of unknown function (DUF5615)